MRTVYTNGGVAQGSFMLSTSVSDDYFGGSTDTIECDTLNAATAVNTAALTATGVITGSSFVGDSVTADTTNADLTLAGNGTGAVAIDNWTGQPYCAAFTWTTTLIAATGTWQAHADNSPTELFDTSPDGNMANVTNSRIDIRKTGYYLIYVRGYSTAAGTAGIRSAYWSPDGSTFYQIGRIAAAGVDGQFADVCITPFTLASGSYVKLYFYQTSGTTMTFGHALPALSVTFGVTYLSA